MIYNVCIYEYTLTVLKILSLKDEGKYLPQEKAKSHILTKVSSHKEPNQASGHLAFLFLFSLISVENVFEMPRSLNFMQKKWND